MREPPPPQMFFLSDLIRSEQSACQEVNSGRGVKKIEAYAVFKRVHGVDTVESVHVLETEAEQVAMERNAAENGPIVERKRGGPARAKRLRIGDVVLVAEAMSAKGRGPGT